MVPLVKYPLQVVKPYRNLTSQLQETVSEELAQCASGLREAFEAFCQGAFWIFPSTKFSSGRSSALVLCEVNILRSRLVETRDSLRDLLVALTTHVPFSMSTPLWEIARQKRQRQRIFFKRQHAISEMRFVKGLHSFLSFLARCSFLSLNGLLGFGPNRKATRFEHHQLKHSVSVQTSHGLRWLLCTWCLKSSASQSTLAQSFSW